MNAMLPVDHHVFVDFENTHRMDLDVVGRPGVHLTLLVGSQQVRLGTDLAAKLVEHASVSRIVQVKAGGKNAVDFALAFHLGTTAERNASGQFHIVSRDTGFDPLVGHLCERGILIVRHPDSSSLRRALGMSQVERSASQTRTPFIERALLHLKENKTNRPKRKATLLRHLTALAGKGIPSPAVEAAVASLIKAGHLWIDEKNAVIYRL